MKKLIFLALILTFTWISTSSAMWIIYQKSTKAYIGNTGTQTLNGDPWVSPKDRVLKNASQTYGILLNDLDAYLVEDTNIKIVDQMFDGEKTPELTFDILNNPIGVVFKDNIVIKRQKRINEIQTLNKELKELIGTETTYALDLTPEKQVKIDRIQKLKTELLAIPIQ